MDLEWYGQSAFRLSDGERTVFIDPFDDMSAMADRGMQWDYPAIEGVTADLLLVTHEHLDHNGVGAIGGDPVVLRGAGTHESPVGEVVGIASEHDDVAGTQRGPNTLFVFSLGGMRVAHLGDLGQAALRDAQRAALGTVDVLMVPVGAGPTIGPDEAMAIVEATGARLVVPMHYRTERIGFLDPLERFPRVHRAETPTVDLEAVGADGDGRLLGAGGAVGVPRRSGRIGPERFAQEHLSYFDRNYRRQCRTRLGALTPTRRLHPPLDAAVRPRKTRREQPERDAGYSSAETARATSTSSRTPNPLPPFAAYATPRSFMTPAMSMCAHGVSAANRARKAAAVIGCALRSVVAFMISPYWPLICSS